MRSWTNHTQISPNGEEPGENLVFGEVGCNQACAVGSGEELKKGFVLGSRRSYLLSSQHCLRAGRDLTF